MPDQPDLPQTKEELLDRIARDWDALQAALRRVPPARMETPDSGGWSVKDNLSHLAEWERYLQLHHLRGQPAHEVLGVDAAAYARLDEDGMNAILFERNRGRPAAEVAAMLQAAHEEVLRELRETPFAELLRPTDPDDPDRGPVLRWIAGNTYEHYQEHLGAIERQAGD